MNWIEKLAENIQSLGFTKYERSPADKLTATEETRLLRAEKRELTQIIAILSHTPVIDAEKLVEKFIISCGFIKEHYQQSYWNEMVNKKAQLISDSIDLNIEWVDGKSRWGIFWLYTSPYQVKLTDKVRWHWRIDAGGDDNFGVGTADTQELAQQACVTGLRQILTGVKE